MTIKFTEYKKKSLLRTLETLDVFKGLNSPIITIRKKERPFSQILDGKNFKPTELFVRRKRKKK